MNEYGANPCACGAIKLSSLGAIVNINTTGNYIARVVKVLRFKVLLFKVLRFKVLLFKVLRFKVLLFKVLRFKVLLFKVLRF